MQKGWQLTLSHLELGGEIGTEYEQGFHGWHPFPAFPPQSELQFPNPKIPPSQAHAEEAPPGILPGVGVPVGAGVGAGLGIGPSATTKTITIENSNKVTIPKTEVNLTYRLI